MQLWPMYLAYTGVTYAVMSYVAVIYAVMAYTVMTNVMA